MKYIARSAFAFLFWVSPIFIAWLTVFTAACAEKSNIDKGHDAALEAKIISLMQRAKQTNLSMVDIKYSSDAGSKRICFQGPYMSRSDFELQVGRRVDSFEQALEDVYVWWIFDERDSSSWIRIPRVSVADKDHSLQFACFDLQDWTMALHCDGSCKYSMRRK